MFVINISTLRPTMKEYEQSLFDKLMLGDLTSMVHMNKYVYRGVTAFKRFSSSVATYYEFIYINKYGNIRTICLQHPYSQHDNVIIRDYKIPVIDDTTLNYVLSKSNTYDLFDLGSTLTVVDLVVSKPLPERPSDIMVNNIAMVDYRSGTRVYLLDSIKSINYTDTIPEKYQSQLLQILLPNQIFKAQTALNKLNEENESLVKQVSELTIQLKSARDILDTLQPILAKLDILTNK